MLMDLVMLETKEMSCMDPLEPVIGPGGEMTTLERLYWQGRLELRRTRPCGPLGQRAAAGGHQEGGLLCFATLKAYPFYGWLISYRDYVAMAEAA